MRASLRPSEPAESTKDARREEILSAASRVFARRGFAATKVSDIAKEAGLSHGLVYHYFSSKEAVFEAVVEEALGRFDEVQRIGTSAEEMRCPLLGVEKACEAAIAYTVSRPETVLILTTCFLGEHVPDRCRTRVREHAAQSFAHMVERVRRGQQEGLFDPSVDPSELATAVMCVIRGLSLAISLGPDVPCTVPHARTVLKLLFRSAGPPLPEACDRMENPTCEGQ